MTEKNTLIDAEYIKKIDGELMFQTLIGTVGLEKTKKILDHYELLKEEVEYVQEENLPFAAFGAEELDNAPPNAPPVGNTSPCPKCGQVCETKPSDPPMLSFITCDCGSFLVGIDGSDITKGLRK